MKNNKKNLMNISITSGILEKVGTVTPSERDEILHLFERKNGLTELIKSFKDASLVESLYDKIINDLGKTSTEFSEWWSEKSKKYNWKSSPNGNWEINFKTCEIFLKFK